VKVLQLNNTKHSPNTLCSYVPSDFYGFYVLPIYFELATFRRI